MGQKIKVEITQHQTVELTDKEELSITLACIRHLFDIPESAYIKDGLLMEEVAYTTSHTWWREEKIRTATEDDRKAIEFMAMLKQK